MIIFHVDFNVAVWHLIVQLRPSIIVIAYVMASADRPGVRDCLVANVRTAMEKMARLQIN